VDHDRQTRTPAGVLVAAEHVLVLEVLTEALNTLPEFEVVAMISNPDNVVPTARRLAPRVAVLETNIGGRCSIDLVPELRNHVPRCGVVLIAAEPTHDLVDRALAAGVLSVIPKHVGLPYLVHGVRSAAAGCLAMHPALLDRTTQRRTVLNDREREVLRLSAGGASVKEIAQDLFLSAGTVRNVASKAIRKLAGRNRFDAARIARERGWL
jgi:two-component system, NarL family, response regulator DesR